MMNKLGFLKMFTETYFPVLLLLLVLGVRCFCELCFAAQLIAEQTLAFYRDLLRARADRR